MEIVETTYACPPVVLSGNHDAGTLTAVKGIGMSSASAARNRTTAPMATALLPISVLVATGFATAVVVDAIAGIRSWSPPV